MSNLLVIHQLFPCMFVGFNAMGSVWKIGEELWRVGQLATNSWVEQPTKGHVRSTCWKLKGSSVDGILQMACDLANSQPDSRDALLACFVCLSSFFNPHYKSLHYPQYCKENFKEKTIEIHWKVRDCLPTILTHFS